MDNGIRQSYEYKRRPWYPHMGPADQLIWDRFILKYPNAYEYVEYDVDVGEGPDFDTVVNDATGGDDIKLYKKKIDVVGHKGNITDIIEIKPNAGLGAFGQILSYDILYLENVDNEATTRAVIITDRLSPDMAHLATYHEVEIIVV